MSTKSATYLFYRDRYQPVYRVASWWETLKSICWGFAVVAAVGGMIAASEVGAGGFFGGLVVAGGLVITGLVFEVFASLLRVLIDQAVSQAPMLSAEDRFALIQGSTAVTAPSSFSASSHRNSVIQPEMRYCMDRGIKEVLMLSEIADRVNANPDADHLVWKAGMPDWVHPSELLTFSGLLDEGDVEDVEDEATG